ncbi:hypothetical protein TrST_g5425 [Triparma strigata]|uniref:Uncharacterized protein n=1 Tax=Triparma strigata TaxID=1606541 RepID=A0A9W7AH12_9STRA|nr:hypothetical protein TrST_g5425 [Triparma strigata]
MALRLLTSRAGAASRSTRFALSRGQTRQLGAGPSPPVPPFARNLAPSQILHEEHELVWDDGVAPELTIDFDAQHISSEEGLAWWFAGLGFFASLFGLMAWTDPPSKNPALNRMVNIIPDAPAAGADGDADGDEEEDDDE